MENNTATISKELGAINAKINFVNRYYPDQTYMLDMYVEKKIDLEKKLFVAPARKQENLVLA